MLVMFFIADDADANGDGGVVLMALRSRTTAWAAERRRR
ncbi:MAG: hypothetical protein ACI9MX_000786 [Candidatus Aldehydirespiratoraceae bacterium]|jgi:hypothetical protein